MVLLSHIPHVYSWILNLLGSQNKEREIEMIDKEQTITEGQTTLPKGNIKEIIKNKWFKINVGVALVILLLIGFAANSASNAGALKKSKTKIEKLNGQIEDLDSQVENQNNKIKRLVDEPLIIVASQSCKDALALSMQLAIDYNVLVQHIGESMQSSSYSAVIEEVKAVTDRLGGLAKPAFDCDPAIASKLDFKTSE